MKNKTTVWEWMGEAVQKVKAAFSGINKKLRVYASRSVELTTRIKSVLDNPVTDIITAIIPGTWDNEAVQLMKAGLAKALPYLSIVDSCKGCATLEDTLTCWIAELRNLPEHSRNAILLKLAALLTAYQDNEALRQRLYDLYAQMAYVDSK